MVRPFKINIYKKNYDLVKSTFGDFKKNEVNGRDNVSI